MADSQAIPSSPTEHPQQRSKRDPKRGLRPSRPPTMRQMIELQQSLHADGVNPETSAAARAQVARAFVEIERMKREARGIGKPAPVEAKNQPRKRSTSAAPATPSE